MKLARGTHPSVGSTEIPRADCRTMVVDDGGTWAMDPLPPSALLSVLHDRMCAVATAATPDHALVGVVDDAGNLMGAARLAPGDAVTIGRHSRCQLRLRTRDLSLRHATVQLLPGGRPHMPRFRAWDLATGRPFRTEDGQPTEAVVADGPLFFSIGRFSIACLPLSWPGGGPPRDATEAWKLLPPREIVSQLAEGTGSVRMPESPPASDRISRITRVGGSVTLEARGDPDNAVAELVVESLGRRSRYHLSPERLSRGILVGRYDRCVSRVMPDDSVSRVHLLITCTEAGAWAIDTASTNGSRRITGNISAVRLDGPTALELGHDTVVRWCPYGSS